MSKPGTQIVVSIFLLILALTGASVGMADTIRHLPVSDEKETLLLDILKLALSKSDPAMKFEAHPDAMTATRAIEVLKDGGLDVFWAGVTPDYEAELMPVYRPVLKGLLGHRIFIIEQGKQHLFDGVQTLEDLRKLKAGQGTTWGDTLALKGAGLPTVTTMHYRNLFPMLEGDRFDYFPRAVHEPWSEIRAYPELNLTVENRILLVYPFAMYFFVNKDNKALHDKIHRGLEMATEDGSYNEIFFESPMVKNALTQSRLADRIVIRIPNPGMSEKNPFDRKDFWLDLDSLE